MDNLSTSHSANDCWLDNEWTWEPEDRALWIPAGRQWQQFYDQWRKPGSFRNETEFPYILEVVPASLGIYAEDLSAHALRDTHKGQAMIPHHYSRLYDGLYSLRDEFPDSGVIIGGQPGIGT